MTEKKEPKFIGRYGEVLENVTEYPKWKPSKPGLKGMIADIPDAKLYGEKEKWRQLSVIFEVSKKTNKKNGAYIVFNKTCLFNNNLNPEELLPTCLDKNHDYPYLVFECNYNEDVLHGKEIYFVEKWGALGTEDFLNRFPHRTSRTFIRGKRMGQSKIKKRLRIAEKSTDLRELFSDNSVKEAIKTGSLLKVKSAMTRALKKKEMGE